MENRKGSVLIIALIMVAFLGALAVAVMDPVSASRKVTTVAYNQKQATIAAQAVAERVKAIMCLDGAVAEDGTSQCVLDAIAAGIWTPISFEDNGNADAENITFPSIDLVGADGNPVFDPAIADPDFPPLQGANYNEIRYIAYTAEDGAGNAISYVSAECNGVVRNLRVSYHRELVTDFPHPSYLRAIYAANTGSNLYTFLLDSHTGTITDDVWDWLYWDEIRANSFLSSTGCINLQPGQTKGYLGFNIPNKTLKAGTNPSLYLYLLNIPAYKDIRVKVHRIPGPLGTGYNDYSQFGEVISTQDIDGMTKRQYVPFEIDEDIWNAHKGGVLQIALSYEKLEADGPTSAVHFKCKDSRPPIVRYETEETVTGTDEVTGDIFINGDANITKGSVTGGTEATGSVWGDGDGEESSSVDMIPPPDLTKGGDWYLSLGLNPDGTSSTNIKVVTDASDGIIDNRIAGIICPHTETGESQDYMDDDATSTVTYVLDSNFGVEAGPSDPTYHSDTDSVIVTVPETYNNKAIYIPGDFWCDILNPTFIDFRTPAGDPVTLTFIVEGNIYLTDGVNRKKHPDSITGGAISFIALKNDSGQGGNIFYGDPSAGGGRLDPVQAYLYAENNFKWYQKAQDAGLFDIIGNMTAGNLVDFTDRKDGLEFVPIDVQFDPALLDADVRKNLPCLPRANRVDVIPGTPYEQCGMQYL
jgi:hypothetical protein